MVQGSIVVKCCALLSLNIATIAGLPPVYFQQGGSMVASASLEVSKRLRYLSSLCCWLFENTLNGFVNPATTNAL